MKSQIHRTSKAHLLRVAFYLLLLLAACAIPFALAQRNVATRSKAKASPVSEFPVTSNAAAAPAIAVSVFIQSRPRPLSSSTIRWTTLRPRHHPPPSDGVIHRRTTSPNSTIMTALLLTISSCQKTRFGISLKWMSSANLANLPFRPIRSMFFSTQIAARCQGRWLQAGSPTHTADSLLL